MSAPHATRRPLFAECTGCGERWKLATIPLDIKDLVKATNGVRCPNCCAGGAIISLCATHGPKAVNEARNGRATAKLSDEC